MRRPTELESAFQAKLIQTAVLMGWLVYHTHDSRRSAKGFPDLVLARERVVFAELKAMHGKLSEEQKIWRNSLELAGAEVYVWRPNDWDDIMQVLKRRGRAVRMTPPHTTKEA